MKLVLIRHGKTDANEKRMYCGSTDISLSEKGRKEISGLKSSVAYPDARGFDVLTSGKKRCEETLFALFGNMPHRADARFSEIDFGAFEMHTYDELKERSDYIEWITGDNEANVAPGGESGNIMKARVINALDELILSGRDTILITHGGVIAAIMEHLFPDEGKNRYEWQPAPGRGYLLVISGKEKHRAAL